MMSTIFPPDIEELFERLNSYKKNNLSLDKIINNELIFNKIDITRNKQSKIINQSFQININDDDDDGDLNIINGVTNGGRSPSYDYNNKDLIFKHFNTEKLINFLNINDVNGSLIWCIDKTKQPKQAHKAGFTNEDFKKSTATHTLGILLYNIFVIDFDNISDIETFKKMFPNDFNNNVISEKTKKGAHYYFKRPIDFDDKKIYHRRRPFEGLDIDLLNRYEGGTRGLCIVTPSINKEWIVAPWEGEIKEPSKEFNKFISEAYETKQKNIIKPRNEKTTTRTTNELFSITSNHQEATDNGNEQPNANQPQNIYNYGINDFDEIIEKKYFMYGTSLKQKYNLSFEDIAHFLHNAPWFAYWLLIPNNGKHEEYFKIAYSCYNEVIKTNNKLILNNDDVNDDEDKDGGNCKDEEKKHRTTQNKIYDRFLKYFYDFAKLSPFERHQQDILNKKDIIINDLRYKKIDSEKYKYMNVQLLRKYAKAAEPEFFDKYDAITLLKKHFTLNFDLVPNLKVNFQNCPFLCMGGTEYENVINEDTSKTIIIISRLGGGKTVTIFKNIQKYKKILFISPRIAFAHAIQNDFSEQGLEITNYDEHRINVNIINGAPASVISLESLHKLDKNIIYDCIILDEVESIITQFKSDKTFTTNINDVNNKLMNYINKATRVFCADALMSNKTLNYIKYFEGSKSIHINTVKKLIDKKAFQIKPDTQKKEIFNSPMLSFIKESIYKDENIFIATSSKTKLKKYKNFLKAEGHTNKIISDYMSDYNSLFYYDDMDNGIKNESLKNINIVWSQKKIVATTPIITVGNSFNENEARKQPNYIPHFKHVLLMCGPGSCCVRDTIQTHKRVRYTQTNNIFFNITSGDNPMNKANGIYKIILSYRLEEEVKNKIFAETALLKYCNIDDEKHDDYILLIKKSKTYSEQLKEVISASILEEGLSDYQYKKMFLAYLKIDGYDLELLKFEDEDIKNTDDDYIIEEEKTVLYDVVRDLVDIEYTKITSQNFKNKLTEINKLEIFKHQFKRKFEIIEDHHKHLFLIFVDKHKQHIINNSFFEEIINYEYLKSERGIPKYILYDYKTEVNYYKLLIIKKLNKILGIETTTKGGIISRGKINDIIHYLNNTKQILNFGFGIRDRSNNDYNFRSGLDLITKIYKSWNDTRIKGDETTKDRKTKQYKQYIIINGLSDIKFKKRDEDIDYSKCQFSEIEEEKNLNFDLLDEIITV
jgi:hypothetical protein